MPGQHVGCVQPVACGIFDRGWVVQIVQKPRDAPQGSIFAQAVCQGAHDCFGSQSVLHERRRCVMVGQKFQGFVSLYHGIVSRILSNVEQGSSEGKPVSRVFATG